VSSLGLRAVWGWVQERFCSSSSCGHACFWSGVGVSWPVGEVGDESFLIAEPCGAEVEDRFGIAVVVPEFLAALDSLTHHLDPGFHRAARDWQAVAAVLRVVHSASIVLEVAVFAVEDAPGVIGIGLGVQWWGQPVAGGDDFLEYFGRAALPAECDPAFAGSVGRVSGGVEVFRGVDEVEDRREG